MKRAGFTNKVFNWGVPQSVQGVAVTHVFVGSNPTAPANSIRTGVIGSTPRFKRGSAGSRPVPCMGRVMTARLHGLQCWKSTPRFPDSATGSTTGSDPVNIGSNPVLGATLPVVHIRTYPGARRRIVYRESYTNTRQSRHHWVANSTARALAF